MKIILNGAIAEADEGESIAALLQRLAISRERVAVELNANIIAKADYEKQLLAEDDKIEIVHFVGGG